MNIEATIKIEPFSEFAACPKCGEADEGTFPAVSMNPRPGDDSLPPVRIAGFVKIQTRYCRGGLELEAKEQDPSLAMVGAMASMIGKQVELGQPKLNICAGVLTEHLHKICSRCQYEFLTETKDSTKEKTPCGQNSVVTK